MFVLAIAALPLPGLERLTPQISTTFVYTLLFNSPTTGEAFTPFNGTVTLQGAGSLSVGNDLQATINMYKRVPPGFDIVFSSVKVSMIGAYIINEQNNLGFPEFANVTLSPVSGHWIGSTHIQYFQSGPHTINVTWAGITITSPKGGTVSFPSKTTTVSPFLEIASADTNATTQTTALTISLTFVVIMLTFLQLRREVRS